MISFCLLLFALSATAFGQQRKPVQNVEFQAGLMYVYEYTSRLLTGIPELDDQYSGFELTADLFLQPRAQGLVALKLNNVKVGRVNDDVPANYEEDIDMVHRYNKEYQRELTKPIRFIHENGKVKAFEADRSEPAWSLNIKKSILSLFNINLTPQKIMRSQQGNLVPKPISYKDLTYYGLYERGIAGICETIYEVKHIPDPEDQFGDKAFVLNVTKTRNYDNCLTEPTIVNENYDTRGCLLFCRKRRSFSAVAGYYPIPDAVTDPMMSGCPCDREPNASPVDQYNYVVYNISNVGKAPIIEEVLSEGKVVYNLNGAKILVSTFQNASLVKKVPSRQLSIPSIQQPVRHEELAFRIPVPQLPAGPKLPQDIPYFHVFASPNYQEVAQNLPKVFEKIANDIIAGDVSSTENTMQKVVEAVHQLAIMPIDVLEALYQDIAQKGRLNNAEDKDQILRQLFLDALPLAGTNNAAILIKRLIEANYVSTYEAKNLVEAVPKHMFLPDVATIDAYFELCQNPIVKNRQHLFASTCIAFSKLVAEGCVRSDQNPGDIPNDKDVPQNKRHLAAQMVVSPADPRQTVISIEPTGIRAVRAKRSAPWNSMYHHNVCKQADIMRYVQAVSKLFQEAQTFKRKLVYIRMLTNMKVHQVLPVLEPYISGRVSENACPGYAVEDVSQRAEECVFTRTAVMMSLVPLFNRYPKQIKSLCLPVFRDQSEPYQLRIAAFHNVMNTAPDSQILESIASQLHSETNKQVRSYVVSALQSFGNLSLPCYQKIAKYADDAYDYAPEAEYGMHYSKFLVSDVYDEDKDYGVYGHAHWIANNNSKVPRELSFEMREQVGPLRAKFFRVSIHQKGFERFVERVLEPHGLFSDMFEGLVGKQQQQRKSRSKRNTNSVQQALESLKSKLHFQHRFDDSPKAEITTRLFGRTSYYAIDEKEIKAIINQLEDSLGDVAQALLDGYSGHFVRLFMPASLEKLVSSEIGLPVIVSHKNPILFSLKIENAKVDLASHPRTIYPVGLNFSAILTPQVMMSSIVDVSAVSPGRRLRFGSYVENSHRIAVPVEVNFGYIRPKNVMTFSVIPRLPNKAYVHTSTPKTYISRSNIATAPEIDSLHDFKTISSMAVPFKDEGRIGQEVLGVGIHYQVNTEDYQFLNDWLESCDDCDDEPLTPVINFLEYLYNPSMKAREVHVNIEPDSEVPTYGVDATLRYKWIADEEGLSDMDDSDESAASDESDSDESNSSNSSDDSKHEESDSSETSEESSESTNDSKSESKSGDSSSSESKESKEKLAKKLVHKLRVHKIRKHDDKSSDSSSSSSESDSDSKDSSEEDSKDSSPETSEENDSKSDSSKSNSDSNDDSKSGSSSSSESDSSASSSSMEESVFDYEDVLALIVGHAVEEHNIKKITKHLIEKTKESWLWAYDDDMDESSSDESSQNEKDIVPATITHDVAFTAVTRGPRQTYLALNALYIHTLDHRTNWIKVDGHIKTPVGAYVNYPNLFCADAVVAYPPAPGDLSYDPTTMQGLKAKVKAELGWGPKCQGEGGVIVVGVLEKTEDHVWNPEDFKNEDGSNVHHIQDWFYHQCEIDKSEGKTLSYACDRAILKESLFNRFIVDVKYKNVPKQIQNISHHLDLALKAKYYENMENNAIDVDNEDNQLRIIADYSASVPDLPLVNVHIAKPEEETNYEKVYVPYFRPPSAVYSYSDVLLNLHYGFQQTASSCALMESAVRTFDNVSYNLPQTKCQYLVAMDCSPREKWAVFATTLDPEANTKKLTVMTNGQQIKLLPPFQQEIVQIVVDGKTLELKSSNPQIFCNGQDCLRVYLQNTKSDAIVPIVIIEDPSADLVVKYDGKNAKIEAGSVYKGKTCGLCGNSDDETDDEFVGPALCVYSEVNDFVNSYALHGPQCSTAASPTGKVRCPKPLRQPGAVTRITTIQTRREPSESTTVVRQRTNVQTTTANKVPACQVLRNQYIQNEQMVCFSTRPLRTCDEPCQPTATTPVNVEFHCLTKSSSFTKNLMAESQTSILSQLRDKKVDLREILEVPNSCVPS